MKMIASMKMEIRPKKTILLLVFLLKFFSEPHPSFNHHHRHSILTDKAALLAFKDTLTEDGRALLANWNNATDACDFMGVLCNKKHHRVVELRLNRTGIQGLLSPVLANLTLLQKLDLSENYLRGPIPPEFGSLSHLVAIDLSRNLLNGPIPTSISFLSHLTYLALGGNFLTGDIPTSVFYNCTSLTYVDLSGNALHGEIPPFIGDHLLSLRQLQLYSNKLSGTIPPSLSNCTELRWLDVEDNSLLGELPSEILGKLYKLDLLLLSDNHFTSHDGNTNLAPFFAALSNCTSLTQIELAGNGIGGRLPSDISKLGINFSHIYLERNLIFGSIPPSVAKLSNLTLLNLSSNLLNGTIPDEIGGLLKLQQLILSNNSLVGPIPSSIRQSSLLQLDLSMNKLFGEIPSSLGNLSFLSELFLQENNLSGPIPPALAKCKSLNKLDLSFNRLTSIPKEILELSEMEIFLNLSHNLISGPLPLELSKLEAIQEIDLSSNHFNGSISPQLESCIAVRVINLSHNSLEGKLPNSLGKLRYLEALDVSHNFLSGEIPMELGDCANLSQLNLSCNNFNGPIPTNGTFANFTFLSFLGNPKLCGSIPHIHPCRKRKRLFMIIVSIFAATTSFLLMVCCIFGFKSVRRKIVPRKDDTLRKSTPSLKLSFPRITYKELAEATVGFDQGRLIGSGSFGHVYRGVLRDGTVVAVKVLHLQPGNSTKSFNRECQVLKRIRHRNLMRIVTACSLPDFKALVLPFMGNGSLESHLYPATDVTTGLPEPSELELIQRVNICSDIAQGMAYLHHHSPVRVIHCDLKPSNVLLNDDMTALVSDFGIARLVMNVGGGGNGGGVDVGSSTANMLCGSIGYIAPEYAFGSNTSTKGDVYSFGILVLEMVTRKRPTDDMFVGGLSLTKWVKFHYNGRVEKVIDPSLIRSARDQTAEVQRMWEVAIEELIELGILCTQDAPSTRPTMLDAADDLDRLKRYLTGDTSATFTSSLGISSSTGFWED